MEHMRVQIAAPKLSGNELKYVTDCIQSNWISSRGRYVDLFEEEFSKYVGAKYGVAVSNGTTALHLALASIGVGSKDEVIIPTFTMIAAANAVVYQNAKPVLVDSEKLTWNIAPDKIEEKITERTKAIIVVHLYGHPVNMDPVVKVAKKYGLYIIEDAAQAHGTEYKGKKVGSIGHLGCFSFYANKMITTGEGGMILTDDDSLAEKLRKLRDQAYNKELRKWLIHDELGYNYRLTNIQAAIGLSQLEKIEEFIKIHRDLAKLYNSLFKDVSDIILPPEASWARNVYWMYTILVENLGISRDGLIKTLEKEYEIDTRATFCPIHLQPFYKDTYKNEKYPVAELLGKTGMNLPSGNSTTKEEVEYVASALLTLIEKSGKH
jgi:perosamine synthetase